MPSGSDVDLCFQQWSLNASDQVRLIHAGVYTILSTFSALLNVLLLVVIGLEWKRLNESKFYCLVICLSSASLVYLAPNFLLMIPCTAFACDFYGNTVMVVFASLNTIGYYGSLFATFGITAERFMLFFAKNVHFFFSRHIWKAGVGAALGGLGVMAFTVTVGCYKRFNRHTFQYTFFCSECDDEGTRLSEGLFILGQVLPGMMLAAYAVIFTNVAVNRRRTTASSNSQDCRLVFQFTLICTFQWFSAFFFYMVPRVFGTTHYGVMATNVCGILNTAVNPVVLFLFNSRIRHGFSKNLRFGRSTTVSSLHNTHPSVTHPRGTTVGTTLPFSVSTNVPVQ
uniref:G_PROTEIN_RECEP_F1_2 domain-containing protein n=1 Tax=Steinernema glaseri TaxID=37863 RepID=A0A1I7YP89_9BILA